MPWPLRMKELIRIPISDQSDILIWVIGIFRKIIKRANLAQWISSYGKNAFLGGLPSRAMVALKSLNWNYLGYVGIWEIPWAPSGGCAMCISQIEILNLKSCLRFFVFAKDDIWRRLRQKSKCKRPKQCHDMWNIDLSSFNKSIFILLTNHFNAHVNRNQILTRNHFWHLTAELMINMKYINTYHSYVSKMQVQIWNLCSGAAMSRGSSGWQSWTPSSTCLAWRQVLQSTPLLDCPPSKLFFLDCSPLK